jgi:hypothetical protein
MSKDHHGLPKGNRHLPIPQPLSELDRSRIVHLQPFQRDQRRPSPPYSFLIASLLPLLHSQLIRSSSPLSRGPLVLLLDILQESRTRLDIHSARLWYNGQDSRSAL